MKLFDSIADLGRSAIELVLGFGRAGLMLWGAIFAGLGCVKVFHY